MALAAFNVFAEIPECEKCIAEKEGSPFRIHPVIDGIVIGTSAAATAAAFILPHKLNLTPYYEKTYCLDDVNSFDRFFARPYNRNLDHLATGTVSLCYGIAPVIFLGEFIGKNLQWQQGIEVLCMYAETVLIANSTKNLLKMAVQRNRPYMYYDGMPEKHLKDNDFQFSFPSGHSIDAFMGATFASYTFCKYYPSSKFKIPVIAVSYSLAATTAALRVASGNHFVTDILAGAAIGSAIGFLVPWMHTIAVKASTENLKLSLSPLGATLSIKM